MGNPLFNTYGNNNIIQKFMQFKNSYNGDPKQQIQQMLNSGQLTQEQYNQAVEKANQLQMLLNGFKNI